MVSYKLIHQKVDVTLDFDNYTLKGSTHLKLRKIDGTGFERVQNDEKYMIPVSLPLVGNSVYKRVLLDDSEVQYVVLKPVDNAIKSKILEESYNGVDLMSYEGLHLSVQSLNDSIMYIEIDPAKLEFGLDIFFDYYDMTAMNSEIYFEKHWILPRASTNYREYKLLVSAKSSYCWFPTFFNQEHRCFKYEFNVTVPVDYNVICGFPVREGLGERQVTQYMTTKTFRFASFNVTDHELSMNNADFSLGVQKFDVNGTDRAQTSGVALYESFGLFAGQFDFRDGLRVDKKEEIPEELDSDEELVQMSKSTFELKTNSKLIYVTLRGFGYLLEPTNIATTLCLETYKTVLEMELCGLYLLFLPTGTFPESMDSSSCLRSQNHVDFKRCSGFTASENYLFCSFMDPMTRMYHDLYYKSGGNMVVYSLEVLHSYTDLTHDPKCVDKRIAIATGLSSLYVRKVHNAARHLHLNLMLQTYLVDQFIKRNLGATEHKLRLWSRRELFATMVELLGDYYPLTVPTDGNASDDNSSLWKGAPVKDQKSTSEKRKARERHSHMSDISEQVLMEDVVFMLKCQLIPSVLESIIANTSFLTESFIVTLFKRFLSKCSGRPKSGNQSEGTSGTFEESDNNNSSGDVNNCVGDGNSFTGSQTLVDANEALDNSVNAGVTAGSSAAGSVVTKANSSASGAPSLDGHNSATDDPNEEDDNIWEWLLREVLARYVLFWNSKPQNRLNKDKKLAVEMGVQGILRKGEEHDQLRVCITNLQNLVKSYIYGTGCPQISMGLILQLQRKGTSMDHLSFRVDVNSLQPPLDINDQGQTKYTLVEITSQSAKNLYNIYSKLLQLTHYTQQSNSDIGDDVVVYKMLLNIFNVTTVGPKDDIVDFGDQRDNMGLMSFSEIGLLKKKMCLHQTFFDSVDMIGRDGNFVMGFGYIGNYPWPFCLGYGPLWDCVEMLKNSLDINKITDLLIDNGTNYCGTTIKSDYKLQFNPGQIPIATSGGMPYWKLVLVQQSLIQNGNEKTEDKSILCLSGGYAKKWMFYLISDIVEDDGVRESIKLLGELVPVSYNVNPRATRGRKKVALKGIAEDLEKDLQNSAVGPFTNNTGSNTYLGLYSECDRHLVEWMKQLYMSLHPELTQLDNRSIVAKICSKTRLPLLWIRVDSAFSMLARIRRCQSGSMWEQQLQSDNNIYSLIEACQALGSFGKSEYISDNPLAESACKRLDAVVKKQKAHPFIRARCVYSLVCLYNRDPRQHTYLYGFFTKYLTRLANLSIHPAEARFIAEFYKALCLLRNEQGFTPEFVLDILSNTIENLTGPSTLTQATNLMESASYLNPPDVTHTPGGGTGHNSVFNLWDYLWHMFRLDGIPGSCSPGRALTSKFLLCLSRQPVFLKLCVERFKNERDLGFDFDPLLFLPLRQHVNHKFQSAFELSQSYNSILVQRAAIRLALQLLLQCSYRFKLSVPEGLVGFSTGDSAARSSNDNTNSSADRVGADANGNGTNRNTNGGTNKGEVGATTVSSGSNSSVSINEATGVDGNANEGASSFKHGYGTPNNVAANGHGLNGTGTNGLLDSGSAFTADHAIVSSVFGDADNINNPDHHSFNVMADSSSSNTTPSNSEVHVETSPNASAAGFRRANRTNSEAAFEYLLVNELFNEGVDATIEAVEPERRLRLLHQTAGLLECVKCACFLFHVARSPELKIAVWEMFHNVLFETCMSKPILFLNLSSDTLERARRYMLVILKKASVSKLPFYLKLFPKIHKAYSLLFGFGTLFPKDPKPDKNFVNQRIYRLTSGLSMPKIASFKRAYGEGESGSGDDWQNVALEAVRALKEIRQSHWFHKDPEKEFKGYRSLIKKPIWLNKIEQKALNRSYTIPMQFKADIALLFKNAKLYNKVDTIPYKDAVMLEEQFDTLWPCIVKAFQKKARMAVANQ
ncbi:hypothetical protein MACJ_002778 [Theileria orientalis]|uniref:Bromo domain-containing protein n=1 Tax=Theileria orientalis TaxID=68886 RepID=A0A976QQR5_THEOR|nr:hypothetical protein MACJ_002778 [Theileria orientalis]